MYLAKVLLELLVFYFVHYGVACLVHYTLPEYDFWVLFWIAVAVSRSANSKVYVVPQKSAQDDLAAKLSILQATKE